MSGNHRLSNTSLQISLFLCNWSLSLTRMLCLSHFPSHTETRCHPRQPGTHAFPGMRHKVRPLSHASAVSLIYHWSLSDDRFSFLSFCLTSWWFFSSLYWSYLTNAAWSSRQPTRKCAPSLAVSEETRRDALNAWYWRKQLPASSAVPSLSCSLNCANRQRWAMFYRGTLRHYHTWTTIQIIYSIFRVSNLKRIERWMVARELLGGC